MAQYFTPSGLSLLSGFESSNNPLAYSSVPGSHASGLYGFQPRTWQQYAQLVPGASQYSEAYQAPADIQTQVAMVTPVSNWTCLNCDAPITNAIASNPGLVSSAPSSFSNLATNPSSADFDASSADSQDQILQNMGIDPGTIGPSYGGDPYADTGQIIGDASPTFFQNIVANLRNWTERFGLFFVGALLLFAAVWVLADSDKRATIVAAAKGAIPE